jgi:hypothetical protein
MSAVPPIVAPGSPIIFMKIGVHAREPLESIIKRKQDEFAAAGRIFWGYGGGTCHPVRMVQPFARAAEEDQRPVHLVMHKMRSMHNAEPELAREYSDDGIAWYPIPRGINVKGSRYAMVIGGLTEEEFDLNLSSAIVAVGPSRGKLADEYIRGHVDKGCFDLGEVSATASRNIHIDVHAPLLPPYAVFLR